MARTGRSFVTRALRIINAINVGDTPDAEEANDAIDLFNDMLDSWATDSLSIPYTASAEFQTVAGKKVYSVGPGGDWDGIRPIELRDATMRIPNGSPSPLDLPLKILDQHQYGLITLKDTPSTQSRALYYEAQFPLGFVTLWPVPSAVFGVVLSFDAIFNKVTLNSNLDGLPPGYALAIQYNLAQYLAIEYQKTLPPQAMKIATDTLAAIKIANTQAQDAEFDLALPGVGTGQAWDWRTG